MKSKIKHTIGSDNVYDDLGLPASDERLAKAKLAMRIEAVIEKRKLKQIDAAKILKISQPKVSALINGQLSGFSLERLIHFLNLLNQDVKIIIKAKQGTKSHSLGNFTVAFG
jgi:predicted XRE-type DNA-binding protein